MTDAEECSWPVCCICTLLGVAACGGTAYGFYALFDGLRSPINPTFRVGSTSVSPLNLARSQLSAATWKLSISVRNPNRHYTTLNQFAKADVMYGDYDSPLASAQLTLVPLEQRPKTRTWVPVRVEAAPANLSEDTAKSMRRDMSKRSIRVKVMVVVVVEFVDRSTQSLSVNCEGLKLWFRNGTVWTLLNAPGACMVYAQPHPQE